MTSSAPTNAKSGAWVLALLAIVPLALVGLSIAWDEYRWHQLPDDHGIAAATAVDPTTPWNRIACTLERQPLPRLERGFVLQPADDGDGLLITGPGVHYEAYIGDNTLAYGHHPMGGPLGTRSLDDC